MTLCQAATKRLPPSNLINAIYSYILLVLAVLTVETVKFHDV